jgi:hypothetical protein
MKEFVAQLTNGFVWWYMSRNCKAGGIIGAPSTSEVYAVNVFEIGTGNTRFSRAF